MKIFFVVIFLAISLSLCAAETLVHPIETLQINSEPWEEIKRQRIDNLTVNDKTLSVTLRLDDCLEKEIYFDVPKGCINVDSLNHQWNTDDDEGQLAYKHASQRLIVHTNGYVVFNSMNHTYDHIKFRGVCEPLQSLVFDLTKLGTANGNFYKVLVIAHDKAANHLKYGVVEPEYLDQCGIPQTILNR